MFLNQRNPAYKFSLIFIFFVVFFADGPVYSQTKFYTICPEKTIGLNDLLQIQFKIENAENVETIIPPTFKNFEIVNGPNQESGVSIINGNRSQYISIGFFLKPKALGKFTIGAAKARADGKDFTSSAITVEVLKETPVSAPSNQGNSSSPFSQFNFDVPSPAPTEQFNDYILKEGENIDDKIKKNIFLKLEVNKRECFVGEPIVASYKLYTRLNSESTITDAPSFNGFSVSDFNVSQGGSIETLNGRKYNVYVLRKVQLYPLQSGDVVLSPVVADNKITFLKGEYARSRYGSSFYDMLEDFANNTADANTVITKQVSLKSAPETIHVKALPITNKPDNFKGAVGNFKITAALKNSSITTDDAGNLQVTISGSGNIQLINSPEIKWPEGIEFFDATVADDINKTSNPMSGSKVFTFPFVVSKEGNYTIDSISFSYFDPETSEYKIIKTKSVGLTVTKGNGISKSSLITKKPEVESSFFSNNKWKIITGFVVVLMLIFFFYRPKNKKDESKPEIVKSKEIDDFQNNETEVQPKFEIPENVLLAAHERLVAQDSQNFYPVLHTSLKKYLAGKIKISPDEITRKRINEELDHCNVGLNTCRMVNELFDEIELNLYAKPDEANRLNAVFEKASEVVSLLDKQVCS